MPVRMKTHLTEVRIEYDGERCAYRNVPKNKIKALLIHLKDYRDQGVPWREAAKNRIAAHGSEGAYFLRVCREDKGWTQSELAKKLGMPQGNVSQLENSIRPIGKKLAKKLGELLNRDY